MRRKKPKEINSNMLSGDHYYKYRIPDDLIGVDIEKDYDYAYTYRVRNEKKIPYLYFYYSPDYKHKHIHGVSVYETYTQVWLYNIDADIEEIIINIVETYLFQDVRNLRLLEQHSLPDYNPKTTRQINYLGKLYYVPKELKNEIKEKIGQGKVIKKEEEK
jgi:hypothetical protein